MTYLPEHPDASLIDIFGVFPETSELLLRWEERVMRGPSPFTDGEREVIAVLVSGLNACGHCYGTHSGVAEAFGYSADFVAKLVDDVQTSDADERMKPVLQYVRKLTLTPSRMTQADVDAVFAAGWDSKALHDAISVCGLFNFFNRFVSGFGISTPPDRARAGGLELAEIGYAGYIERLGFTTAGGTQDAS